MKKLLCLGLLLCLPTFAHAEGESADAVSGVSEGTPEVDAMGNPTGAANEETVFEPKKFQFTEAQKAMLEEHRGEMMLRNNRHILLEESPSKAAATPEDLARWKREIVKDTNPGDDQ